MPLDFSNSSVPHLPLVTDFQTHSTAAKPVTDPIKISTPSFPSLEWCQTLVDAIHADERSALAGKGWHGTVCVAVLPDETLINPFFVYANIKDGRVLNLRELEDEDEIDEVQPDYVAKAKCHVWCDFIHGKCDPVEALLQRKISFCGDLGPIAQRIQFKQLIWDTLAKVSNTLPRVPS